MTFGTLRTTADRSARPRRRGNFGTALLVSLAGHALLLTTLRSPLGPRPPQAAPMQSITARLQAPTAARAAPPVLNTNARSSPTASKESLRAPQRTQPVEARVRAITTPEAPPAIDLDAARADARHFARQFGQPAPSGDPRGKTAPARQAALPVEHETPAALPALARRIKPAQEHAVETVLADGTRRLRFTGNRCLDLPRELSLAQQNSFGETVRLATNCPE